MGFWKVVGTIGKGALKFVGSVANEICKETLGIDFAEEIKDSSNLHQGMNNVMESALNKLEEEKEKYEEIRDEYGKEYIDGEKKYSDEQLLKRFKDEKDLRKKIAIGEVLKSRKLDE